jgi:hypothetical protein
MAVSTRNTLRYHTVQGIGQTGATTLRETIRPDRWADELRLEARAKEGD